MTVLDWQPRESACEYAIRVILYNIVHLELAPGSEISSNRLSEVLSLSRMPVREALAELSRMGLVEILPQRGSYVSRIDPGVVEESQFMRLVLERAVTGLACRGISDQYRQALEDNLAMYRRLRLTEDWDRTLEADNEFHRLLFASAGKTWIYARLRDQMVHFDRLRMLSMSSFAGRTEELLREHEEILATVIRHDEDTAEELVTRHLSHSLEDVADIMERYPDYFVHPRERAQ